MARFVAEPGGVETRRRLALEDGRLSRSLVEGGMDGSRKGAPEGWQVGSSE
eukprot:CAMPEP_0113696658 /NCGR_PEP_ID=MMETSP0038_2-20120614/21639_1 /TAXON_ID=2898 /ORGANISM="Cryptomonas paramecium" /LENGTH=50 /DNA_ID=CAMNT_0000619459 /DNA_START=291 /DNA_END=443 /DNA_ORIENTATION=+ /assembly_acc=CAM_ASM_000170